MPQYSNLKIGSVVKNSKTGDVGIVKKIIYDKDRVFGVVVKTKKGRQKWIIQKRKKTLYSKVKDFLRLK